MTAPARSRQPNYLQQTGNHQDRWMISYADIVTILLVLFISIAAQTSEKAPKSPQPATPRPAPVAAPRQPDQAFSAAQTALQKHGVTPKIDPRGLVITLPQAILFPAGEDSILPDALPVIEQIAAVLREMDNNILLVGHADATPIHNRHFRNNWELSAARSIQLLQVLTGRFGLSEARFSVASEGSHSPLGSNEDDEGRAQNRRVEIVILDDTSRPTI